MKLLLFDIDGTLLKTNGLGKEAFEAALSESYGRHFDLSKMDWFGRTDKEVVTLTLKDHGYTEEEIKKGLPHFYKRFAELFESYAEKEKDRFFVFEGVVELLNELSEQKNFALALVTGNLMQTAFLKLKGGNLTHYFPFGVGGFGDDSHLRKELVVSGLERSKNHYGDSFSEIFVIGDSHRDITAAKEAAKEIHLPVKTLSVATGQLKVCELATFSPDFLLEDFKDTKRVIRAFIGEASE